MTLHISVLGWDGPRATVAILFIALALGYVLGAWRTRKKGSIAQRKLIKAEWTSVRAWRESVDCQALAQDARNRELNRRDAEHDDTFREIVHRGAVLDQREAAIEARERAATSSVLFGVNDGAEVSIA